MKTNRRKLIDDTIDYLESLPFCKDCFGICCRDAIDNDIVCPNFDKVSHLCNAYDKRSFICRLYPVNIEKNIFIICYTDKCELSKFLINLCKDYQIILNRKGNYFIGNLHGWHLLLENEKYGKTM